MRLRRVAQDRWRQLSPSRRSTAAAATFALERNHSYQFRARGVDADGRRGDWAVRAAAFRVDAYQENYTAANPAFGGTWTRVAGSRPRSTASCPSLARRATGRRTASPATTSRGSGRRGRTAARRASTSTASWRRPSISTRRPRRHRRLPMTARGRSRVRIRSPSRLWAQPAARTSTSTRSSACDRRRDGSRRTGRCRAGSRPAPGFRCRGRSGSRRGRTGCR